MSAALEPLDASGHHRLRGDVDFDAVPRLWREGEHLFDGDTDIVLDLAGVQRMDSAGLALLVGWLAGARQAGHELRLISAPPQLRAIAEISGVGTMLGLEAVDAVRG